MQSEISQFSHMHDDGSIGLNLESIDSEATDMIIKSNTEFFDLFYYLGSDIFDEGEIEAITKEGDLSQNEADRQHMVSVGYLSAAERDQKRFSRIRRKIEK